MTKQITFGGVRLLLYLSTSIIIGHFIKIISKKFVEEGIFIFLLDSVILANVTTFLFLVSVFHGHLVSSNMSTGPTKVSSICPA